MNPKVIFKLHEPQHGIEMQLQKMTYIHMFFSYGYFKLQPGNGNRKKYIPMKYSTGLLIKPCYWDDRPVYRAKTGLFEEANHLNKRLDFLQDYIQKIYRSFEVNGIQPTPAQLKERFDLIVKGENQKPLRTLNSYITAYISEARSGERLSSKNSKYRNVSIKNLQGFQVQFGNYQKSISKTLDYEHITVEFLADFIRYFKEKNYSRNTISRHVKHLLMFMRSARQEGYHNNTEIDRKQFRISRQEVEQTYLNEDELNRMYKLDLSNQADLEIVRDVFLLGCYLAQRYNDYKAISKKQIIALDNKSKAIVLFQSRSGRNVILPLRSEAISILKKYNFTLPYTYEQQVNSKIREIAEMAGIDQPVETSMLIDGKRVRKVVPRHHLIKTHTARRSGCTNMYLANVPVNEIMAISGHQTVFDFMKYIRASEIQIAVKLSLYPWFNGS